MVSGTGPKGHTPSERGMFTSVSCVEGWLEGGCVVVVVMMISTSTNNHYAQKVGLIYAQSQFQDIFMEKFESFYELRTYSG